MSSAIRPPQANGSQILFASDPYADMQQWARFLKETYNLRLREDEMNIRPPQVERSTSRFRIAVLPRSLGYQQAIESLQKYADVKVMIEAFDGRNVFHEFRDRALISTTVYWVCDTTGPCSSYFGKSFSEISTNPRLLHTSLLQELVLQTYSFWFGCTRSRRHDEMIHSNGKRILCTSLTTDGYPVTIGHHPTQNRIEIDLIHPEEGCSNTSIRRVFR